MEISAIKGGGRRLMANAIKNSHLFFLFKAFPHMLVAFLLNVHLLISKSGQ